MYAYTHQAGRARQRRARLASVVYGAVGSQSGLSGPHHLVAAVSKRESWQPYALAGNRATTCA